MVDIKKSDPVKKYKDGEDESARPPKLAKNYFDIGDLENQRKSFLWLLSLEKNWEHKIHTSQFWRYHNFVYYSCYIRVSVVLNPDVIEIVHKSYISRKL